MKKTKYYTVYLLTPYCEWENIKAASGNEAIEQCDIPSEFDLNEAFTFIAIEEKGE